MEYWNNGMMGLEMKRLIMFFILFRFALPLFQYSTIPIIQ